MKKSAIVGEFLRSTSSPSKRCAEHSVSPLEMNVGKKRVKVISPSPAAMESEHPETPRGPVVMKRKRTGHSFRAKYTKKTVPEKSAPGHKEKLPDYQKMEEQVHSDKSEEGLKRIHKHGSGNAIRSCGDHLEAAKKIKHETYNVDEQSPASTSLKVKIVLGNIVKDSTKEKLNETKQILSEQNQPEEDKGERSEEIDRLIHVMEKKCRKRMVKLLNSQQEQMREFQHCWESKRLDLENHYKLESAMNRSILGVHTTKAKDKLKLLDSQFERKMEEHNVLKGVERKKLEEEQLRAREEERQKETSWLAKANACRRGELSAVNGPEQPVELKELSAQENVCGLQVELNKKVPPETVPDENVDYINPVELSNISSKKGNSEGDTTGLPNDLVNQSDETDETVVLPLAGPILESSEQTKASSHHSTMPSLQASENQIPRSSSFDVVLEDLDAQVVTEQTTPPFEGAVSQRDTVTVAKSTNEPQDGDVPALGSQRFTLGIASIDIIDAVTSEESIVKLQDDNAPVLEKQETLQIKDSNSVLMDTVNTVQDQSAQVLEKQNASVASSGHADTLTIPESSIELPDQEVPHTSRVEGSNMDIIDIVTHESSGNLDVQGASVLVDQTSLQVEIADSTPDDIVDTLLHSCVGEAGNCEELVSVDAFFNCNQPLSIVVESESLNLKGSSTQTAEIADTVVVSCKSASQLGENSEVQCKQPGTGSESQVNLERNSSQIAEITDTVLLSHECARQPMEIQELQSNHLVIGSDNQVNLDRNSFPTVEVTNVPVHSHEYTFQIGQNQEQQRNDFGGERSENQVTVETGADVSTTSRDNVAVSQIVESTLELPLQASLQLGSDLSFHPEVASSGSSSLNAAPCQQELGRLVKEMEQLQKSHEDMTSRLKSDLEKEIAEIKFKYDLKLKEAEAEFSLKKNGLNKKWNIVSANQLLAEAFSSYLEDHYWRPGNQQAAPARTSTMQHQSLQHLMRPPSSSIAQPSILGQMPALQQVSQHLMRPPSLSMAHPTILSQPPALQQVLSQFSARYPPYSALPVQTMHHAFAFTPLPFRPSPTHTMTPTGNPSYARNPQTLAASNVPTFASPSISQHFQFQPPQPAGQQPSSTFHYTIDPPPLLNPALSAPEFFTGTNRWAHVPVNRASSCAPQINTSAGSLGQSRLHSSCNSTQSAAATGAICLSDDD